MTHITRPTFIIIIRYLLLYSLYYYIYYITILIAGIIESRDVGFIVNQAFQTAQGLIMSCLFNTHLYCRWETMKSSLLWGL